MYLQQNTNSAIESPAVISELHIIACLLHLYKKHQRGNEECAQYPGFLHIFAPLACDLRRENYIHAHTGCRCSFRSELLTRGGGGQLQHGHQAKLQLSPLQLFPFDLSNLPFKEESVQSCHTDTPVYFSEGTNSTVCKYQENYTQFKAVAL